MPEDEVKPIAVPAIGFSIEAKLTQNRTIVAQFHSAADSPKETLDAMLDRVMESLERQEAKGVVKGLRILIDREKGILTENVKKTGDLRAAYEREWQASGRKGAFELKGQQKTNLDNQQTSIEGLTTRIAELEKQLKECEAMAG